MVDSAIIEKIAKLRRLSTSSNLHEAIAAAKLADKLIAEYRLSEAELEVSSGQKKKTAEKDSTYIYQTGRITLWKDNLAQVLAPHYGCAMYNHITRDTGRKVSNYILIGRKDDMEICRYMFAWLSLEIDRLCKLNCKGEGKIFCQSYCMGAVYGIKAQLDLIEADIKSHATPSQSVALVKLDSRIDEANIVKATVKNLSTKKTETKTNLIGIGYHMGMQDGKNINLHKNLPSNQEKLLK